MKLTLILFLTAYSCVLMAQYPEANTDENKVPKYKLPELLKGKHGKKVKSVKQWEHYRRAEVQQLFEQEVYGKIPERTPKAKAKVIEEGEAMDGLAYRKQVELSFEKNGKQLFCHLLIYLPKNRQNVPVFLGYNFYGNHTINQDPNILLTESWVKDNPSIGIIHNQVTEQSRGARDNHWPVKRIIDAGYGLATIYYGDIDPDWNDFSNGIHQLMYTDGQTSPKANEWGSISAWAWGLSRAMDYFNTTKDVHEGKVIVMGHSRLGKAALWAAALDQRFAIAISNNSGCMGAALSRRQFGETITQISYTFPHWFCKNFKKYAGMEDELMVDQHMLLALIAPRPLYIASAKKDLWADPKGEFLSVLHASPVYELYGIKALPVNKMPQTGNPTIGTIGYHIREGKHDVTDYDWEQFIHFANIHLGKQ